MDLDVGLKVCVCVWGGGGHKHTIAPPPPNKKSGGVFVIILTMCMFIMYIPLMPPKGGPWK